MADPSRPSRLRQLHISPPLLNSACPWATDLADLRALYQSPHTGAVTTRTCLLDEGGFAHDDTVHQFAFFDAASFSATSAPNTVPQATANAGGDGNPQQLAASLRGSVNSLGYSPHPLSAYLSWIETIAAGTGQPSSVSRTKPIIVSVTGTPTEVAICYNRVAALHRRLGQSPSAPRLALEINLSCPNIPGKPPPAYDGDALAEYLDALVAAQRAELEQLGASADQDDGDSLLLPPIGLKTPPYTHAGQFSMLVSGLTRHAGTISFLTATNTLGNCLVFDGSSYSDSPDSRPQPLLKPPSSALGGLAGAPLHPLALGNVYSLRALLDASPDPLVRGIAITGVGGVEDATGYARMRAAGATAVALASALGRKGVGVFGEILGGSGDGSA